jgi:hypothetical protein
MTEPQIVADRLAEPESGRATGALPLVIRYTNKLVSATPAATSAIQTRLFEFRAIHCAHALEVNTRISSIKEDIARQHKLIAPMSGL